MIKPASSIGEVTVSPLTRLGIALIGVKALLDTFRGTGQFCKRSVALHRFTRCIDTLLSK